MTTSATPAAPPLPVTFDDVARAASILRGVAHHTPVLTSRQANAIAGAELFFKCENLQRVGAFKFRGAYNAISQLDDAARARGVIAFSSGNHAQAMALAGKLLGVPVTVVMPTDAPALKLAATRGYGAEVDLEAADPTSAFERLNVLIEQTGRTLVHPFDDPVVLAGAGTVGLEIEEDAPDADAVIVAVGGGGLVSGIRTAIGDRMRVVAVEPELSRALHSGLENGRPTPVTPTSVADGLNAPFAGALPLAICAGIERVLVSEEEIEDAFRFLYERAKLACEPAAAAAAAVVLSRKIEAEKPVVVVSGGNVAARTASAILARP